MSIGSGAGALGNAAQGAAKAVGVPSVGGGSMNPLSMLAGLPGLSFSSGPAISGGVGPITFGAFNRAAPGGSINNASEPGGLPWATIVTVAAGALVALVILKRIK